MVNLKMNTNDEWFDGGLNWDVKQHISLSQSFQGYTGLKKSLVAILLFFVHAHTNTDGSQLLNI